MSAQGKLARLPRARRDELCRWLDDNLPYTDIIARLAGEIPDLNESNITRFRQGEYVKWQSEQARLADLTAKREFALQLARENEGSKVAEAAHHVAAGQIYELLLDLDLQSVKASLTSGNGENYPKVINALARLGKGTLELERYRAQVEEKKAAIQRELDAATRAGSNQGITQETLQRIQDQLNLL